MVLVQTVMFFQVPRKLSMTNYQIGIVYLNANINFGNDTVIILPFQSKSCVHFTLVAIHGIDDK